MTPPGPTPPAPGLSRVRDGLAGSRLTTSRPKSAAPAICIPTIAPSETFQIDADLSLTFPVRGGGASHRPTTTRLTPRSTAYVGFSPRAPSAPLAGAVITTTIGGNFQHVLQANSNSASSRRCSYGMEGLGRHPNEPPSQDADESGASDTVTKTSSSTTAGNVYLAVTARKSAEETAKQLARRIAHYRAQEEKALRDVQQMKQRLENRMEYNDAHSSPRKPAPAVKRPVSVVTRASRVAHRNDVKTPRSREQLEFLTKQRHVIQHRNSEAARRQKEKRQAALERQRQKDAAEQSRRTATKERIRQERQLAMEERTAKQNQLLDRLEQEHHARLRHEQAREIEVQQRISCMREEEQNLVLRLQALHVHQEHIQRGLDDRLPLAPATRSAPSRPQSARPRLASPM